ncbi:hypothetical protein AOLI_G00179080 [Acnodon oligacanthus]
MFSASKTANTRSLPEPIKMLLVTHSEIQPIALRVVVQNFCSVTLTVSGVRQLISCSVSRPMQPEADKHIRALD